MIYQLGEHRPVISTENTFIAESADVIGQVEIGSECSIWFNAVLRGDTDRIVVGNRSNVQDGSVLHTDPGYVLDVGEGVTIGHKVMLHGCTLGDYSLIGINSVVLNGAHIGEYSLLGANSLVPEGKEIPSGVLAMGSPAKVVRELTDDERKKLEYSAEIYIKKIHRFQQQLTAIR
ncbi:gamma carbonic anhydrase family protein [Pleionea sp. CnH1-48]|uniref:gamma carbonic anhydrase family protein n=1 Tax=Pleionea sp. CnH1-48 TaxID=2954494 RepID=UPI002097844F|nr:gamma carbonic anhydrase family protein [Pleionea sp. CnH1-48]MCO7226015.1 gamma carbonic anhydrase family protein [Pleionea sp. CnH1-48]